MKFITYLGYEILVVVICCVWQMQKGGKTENIIKCTNMRAHKFRFDNNEFLCSVVFILLLLLFLLFRFNFLIEFLTHGTLIHIFSI